MAHTACHSGQASLHEEAASKSHVARLPQHVLRPHSHHAMHSIRASPGGQQSDVIQQQKCDDFPISHFPSDQKKTCYMKKQRNLPLCPCLWLPRPCPPLLAKRKPHSMSTSTFIKNRRRTNFSLAIGICPDCPNCSPQAVFLPGQMPRGKRRWAATKAEPTSSCCHLQLGVHTMKFRIALTF